MVRSNTYDNCVESLDVTFSGVLENVSDRHRDKRRDGQEQPKRMSQFPKIWTTTPNRNKRPHTSLTIHSGNGPSISRWICEPSPRFPFLGKRLTCKDRSEPEKQRRTEAIREGRPVQWVAPCLMCPHLDSPCKRSRVEHKQICPAPQLHEICRLISVDLQLKIVDQH
jgi:hypothetical protein